MPLIYFIFVALALLTSCEVFSPQEQPFPVETDGSVRADRIDYDAIRTELGLDRDLNVLGYEEENFNTCEIGHGFSNSNRCHDLNMMVLHFRLLCRDSTGTVSSIGEMTPLANTDVRWELGGAKGIVQTTNSGHGAIQLVSKGSPSRDRLILRVGERYVGVRAHELKMHVLPEPWCN